MATTTNINVSEQGMVTEYLTILRKYELEYGKYTALFFQCGSFMELYGLSDIDDPTDKITDNIQITAITQICNLSLVPKKQIVGTRGKVYMAGVRDYVLNKYVSILVENGYTCIIYIQKKQGVKFIRVLDSIVSIGTHVTFETDSLPKISNCIMSIWIEKIHVPSSSSSATSSPSLLIGMANVNIFTGKSHLFEYSKDVPWFLNPGTFDELERQISIHSPSEMIIITNVADTELNSIKQYCGISSQLIHVINLETNIKALNVTKQIYLEHAFQMYFPNSSSPSPSPLIFYEELRCNVIGTQAFCFLMDFIYEHNPAMLRKITLPEIYNTSVRMLLGNQTLKQLNILTDSHSHSQDQGRQGRLSSVANFLNHTCTAMGSRLFNKHISYPVFDENWLKTQYNLIEHVLNSPNNLEHVRLQMKNIRDIEKLARQIVLKKIYPSSLFSLYTSILAIQNIHANLDSTLLVLVGGEEEEAVEGGSLTMGVESRQYFINYLEKTFIIENCKFCAASFSPSSNGAGGGAGNDIPLALATMFKKGQFEEFDKLVCLQSIALNRFNEIHNDLNLLVENNGIKLHETEKNGLSLQLTKKRANVLKTILMDKIEWNGIKFVSCSTSNDEITSLEIQSLSKQILQTKEQINIQSTQIYLQQLDIIESEHYESIIQSATFIANLDVVLCKAHVAYKYNYCKPELFSGDTLNANATATIQSLDRSPSRSFLKAYDLRHVLIEHLNTKEVYVPNNVCIDDGDDDNDGGGGGAGTQGMLIFGVNTTGKTSLIRSVGIAIILAQSGMYVPCSKFCFRPYKSIFTRILANDNLFHGMSTFAVEMSELRLILKMADCNTLVLGDELCSGTETQSALSIFVAGLIELYSRKCSSLFATHFHEVLNYDEIKDLTSCKIKHMSVIYDTETDKLVYRRKLDDGPGYKMYGIEICKSLHMSNDFLEKAYSLRNKYYSETVGALSHKTTIYNSQKIRGLCEICGLVMSQETHHIKPQVDANIGNGYIGTVHKNHPANLQALCQQCHDKCHKRP